MEKNSKIYIAGHNGLVGSAICRTLEKNGYGGNLLTASHKDLDLERQDQVEAFFQAERPDYVFLAAARVGGIQANSIYPAEFIYSNLVIQTNVIHSAWKNQVKRLLFLGSSCIYPRQCPQPMKEEHLLTGPLEATNEPYAIAKIAGIKMCQAYNRQYGTSYLGVMPTNLYGIKDNFDLETSHVLPALIRKIHEAKEERKPFMEIWGTGRPRREFLFVDDLAEAVIFLMNLDEQRFRLFLEKDKSPLVNIGYGKDITIGELAVLVKDIVGFPGEIRHDTAKPDGTPQKLLDVSIINSMGWKPRVSLREGIKLTYEWCLEKSLFR